METNQMRLGNLCRYELEIVWAKSSLNTLIKYNSRANNSRLNKFIKVKKELEEPCMILNELISMFKEEDDIRGVYLDLYVDIDAFALKVTEACKNPYIWEKVKNLESNWRKADLQAIHDLLREEFSNYSAQRIISLVNKKDNEKILPSGPPSLFEICSSHLANQLSDMTAKEIHQKLKFEAVLSPDFSIGEPIEGLHRLELRGFCDTVLGGLNRLPVPIPVSRHRLNRFDRYSTYGATWKTDGFPFKLLIFQDGSFLVDSKFEFKKVVLNFPRRLSHTLLEGEMVVENWSEEKELRFYVSDLLWLKNENTLRLPYRHRWRMIQDEIIQPLRDYRAIRECEEADFKVKRKTFWSISELDNLLERIPSLSHNSKGLLFRLWNEAQLTPQLEYDFVDASSTKRFVNATKRHFHR
ncbi:hypothetical protein CASFOL_033829 [Castilleja foliolosa]|uniref:mRNA capping enzyme adenylation domain-containing protein n=1 Tax=Castilleja foliolosa TaxID=1961234 RepID=A0ABD3BY35_9LAMI